MSSCDWTLPVCCDSVTAQKVLWGRGVLRVSRDVWSPVALHPVSLRCAYSFSVQLPYSYREPVLKFPPLMRFFLRSSARL